MNARPIGRVIDGEKMFLIADGRNWADSGLSGFVREWMNSCRVGRSERLAIVANNSAVSDHITSDPKLAFINLPKRRLGSEEAPQTGNFALRVD